MRTLITLSLGGALGIGAYYLFRDTLNFTQYYPLKRGRYRLYWITRDNRGKGDRLVYPSFMKMIAYPWLSGRGLVFAITPTKSFHVGLASAPPAPVESDDEGRSEAIGFRHLDLTVDQLKREEWDAFLAPEAETRAEVDTAC